MEDSKNRPSIESTQLLVQYGRSMRAIGEPKRCWSELYSHIARPHPYRLAIVPIVVMRSWYSGHAGCAW